MTILNLHAKQDYLEREATTRDPIRAIAEFVWNALDADSTRVEAALIKNQLGGIKGVKVIDDGVGITPERAAHDFSNLGDSWKRRARQTPELKRAIHGKEGRGRLRFFSLAQKSRWTSTSRTDDGSLQTITLDINGHALERCDVSDPIPATAGARGTTVELGPLRETYDVLDSADAVQQFSTIFAPYILQYPNATIIYNGHEVDPKVTIRAVEELPRKVVVTTGRTIEDLRIKVIEWRTAAESSRQIHFGGDDGIVLGSQAAHVTAPGFEYSAYAYSEYFRELADKNLLELEGLNDPDFLAVLDHIRSELTDHFRARQSEVSLGVIQDLKDEGAYPYEGEPKDELERKERQMFDIATYAVSSYSRDFSKAETSLKRMTLTFLKEAVKHNPDALSTILRAVVNLPKAKQNEFSDLLKKTELGNIITASSLISDRVVALSVLKGMVFDPKFRQTVKERGELDVLVRDNTWIFGEQFHITLPETGLNNVMARVATDLAMKRRRRKITKPDGKAGRVDCFMGRVVPGADQTKREYLLVELKRPSLVLGRKELDQVEDYVNAIRAEPEFLHTDTRWHFYLVASEYDSALDARINQENRPRGLFLEGSNYALWVKTWGEVIRECGARLDFVQDKLKIEISYDDIEARIAELQSLVLR